MSLPAVLQHEIESLSLTFGKLFLEPLRAEAPAADSLPDLQVIRDHALEIELKTKHRCFDIELYKQIFHALAQYASHLHTDHYRDRDWMRDEMRSHSQTLKRLNELASDLDFIGHLQPEIKSILDRHINVLGIDLERVGDELSELECSWSAAHGALSASLTANNSQMAMIQTVQLANQTTTYYNTIRTNGSLTLNADAFIDILEEQHTEHRARVQMNRTFLLWFAIYIEKNKAKECGLYSLVTDAARQSIDQVVSEIAQGNCSESLVSRAKNELRRLQSALPYMLKNQRDYLSDNFRNGSPFKAGFDGQIIAITKSQAFLASLSPEDRQACQTTLPKLIESVGNAIDSAYMLAFVDSCHPFDFYDDIGPGEYTVFNPLLAHEALEETPRNMIRIEQFFSAALEEAVRFSANIQHVQNGSKQFNQQAERIVGLFNSFERKQAQSGMERRVDPATQAVHYVESRPTYDTSGIDSSMPMVNPASGMAMVPGTWVDVGGSAFGTDSNDW